MPSLRSVLAELCGLFIDDGSLVVAILAWIGAVDLAMHSKLIDPVIGAVLLGTGIALLLVENVLRSARSLARKSQHTR